MWRLASALVLACVAFTARPDRGAAQQMTYPPSLGQFTEFPERTATSFDLSDSYVPAGSSVPAESYVPNESYGPVEYGCETFPSMMDAGNYGACETCESCPGLCESTLCSGAKVWGSFELFAGFQRSRQLPPLVTTSPAGPPVTPQVQSGVLRLPSSTILFGGQNVDDNPQFGVRGELGVWLKKSGGRTGVGVNVLYLPESEVDFSANSDGNPILARPYFDTFNGVQASQLVAYPGIVTGSVDVRYGTEITSGEIFLRHQLGSCPRTPRIAMATSGLGVCARQVFNLTCMNRVPGLQQIGGGMCNVLTSMPQTRLDLISGLRYTRLDDRLSITNNLVSLDPSFLGQIGTMLDTFDRFDARNEFQGATLGLKTVSRYGCWTLSMLGKVGLGSMRQEVTIDGQTTITLPGLPSSTRPGGLLAQPFQNIGTFERTQFGVNPEARISLSCDLTCRLSMGAGYHFTYWDNVVVAGDHVNLAVDITQPPNAPSTFVFRESDFFMHAATFFVRWNY